MRKDAFAEMLNSIAHQHLQVGERLWLLRQMVKRPEQFPTCFYSAHPEDVLRFHLLARQERLWHATLKEIIAALLKHYGCQSLDNRIRVNDETIKCDHYILSPCRSFVILIEQKVRDNHDSSKARGQWRENFAPKVRALYQKHGKDFSNQLSHNSLTHSFAQWVSWGFMSFWSFTNSLPTFGATERTRW